MEETESCPQKSSSPGAQVGVGMDPLASRSITSKRRFYVGLFFSGTFLRARSWPHPASRSSYVSVSPAGPLLSPEAGADSLRMHPHHERLQRTQLEAAKGMMSDPNFLRSLVKQTLDSITQSQVKNIRGEQRWMEGTARLVA